MARGKDLNEAPPHPATAAHAAGAAHRGPPAISDEMRQLRRQPRRLCGQR